jgi:hypothetical protein
MGRTWRPLARAGQVVAVAPLDNGNVALANVTPPPTINPVGPPATTSACSVIHLPFLTPVSASCRGPTGGSPARPRAEPPSYMGVNTS